MIFLLSVVSKWYMTRDYQTNKLKRWGFVTSILAQPFWLYAAITAGHWATIAMSVLMFYISIKGINDYFVKPWKGNKSNHRQLCLFNIKEYKIKG